MASVTVECPYCEVSTTASIPDGTEVKSVDQSWEVDIRGPDNLVEVSCDGHHFGVQFQEE